MNRLELIEARAERLALDAPGCYPSGAWSLERKVGEHDVPELIAVIRAVAKNGKLWAECQACGMTSAGHYPGCPLAALLEEVK